MPSLNYLATKMVEYGARVETNASRLHQAAGVAVVKAVAEPTPVDTGDAISNWTLSNGSTHDEVRKAFFPGIQGSTKDANIRATIEDAKEKAEQHSAGQTIFVTNNLDYISDLNGGSSHQAPPGYVQEALAAVKEVVHSGIGINMLDPISAGPGKPPLPDFPEFDIVPF